MDKDKEIKREVSFDNNNQNPASPACGSGCAPCGHCPDRDIVYGQR